MLRICSLRIACYALAFVTVLVVWYYFDPALVNTVLDRAESGVRAAARVLASFTNTPPLLAESLAVDRMHLDRTLVIATLKVLWMAVIVFVTRGQTGWHVRHAIFALIFVHVVLLVAWFGWTRETAAWYQAHAEFVKSVLREFGWHHAETVVLRVLQLHSLIVLAEALLLYSVISSLFERRGLDQLETARRLDRLRR